MFSLQTIFGKGDKFYGLLEASAEAAHASATALVQMFRSLPQAPSLDEFMLARKREKALTAQISQELVNTFVTALDREDIEALSAALNKITKAISKFAERYSLAADRLGDIDFVTRAALLEKAAEVIKQMVGQLRKDKPAPREPDRPALRQVRAGRSARARPRRLAETLPVLALRAGKEMAVVALRLLPEVRSKRT